MVHLHTLIEPTYVLGLSATPYRSDRAKLCFQKQISDAGIHQLIQDGYLSKYHQYTIDNWDVDNVADHYLREPDRWGKSIFFFLTQDECVRFRNRLVAAGLLERFSKALRDNDRHGIAALDPVVTGDSDRDAQIESLGNGDLPLLANCMVLTEGFNLPSLQTAWVRDSSRGPTIQMGGRAFRKFPGLDFKQIVQSKKTDWPFMRTALPEQQYLWMSDEWRSLTLNPLIERMAHNSRIAISQVDVVMPKYLSGAARAVRRVKF